MKEKLLIIIPVYNEEENIEDLILKLKDADIEEIGHILVINDGSTDNTEALVRENGIDILNKPLNLGYGSTLQLGYKYAAKNDYDYIIQIDGDGQHDVANIKSIYDLLLGREGDFKDPPDIVIGSRFLSENNEMKVSGLKSLAIGFFKMVIRIFTKKKITDPTSGLQGLNRDAFSFYAKYGNFDHKYPDLNMIIQMLMIGYTIEEIPAKMYHRKAGKSMHSGIIRPISYMVLISISTISIIIRQREDYYKIMRKNKKEKKNMVEKNIVGESKNG